MIADISRYDIGRQFYQQFRPVAGRGIRHILFSCSHAWMTLFRRIAFVEANSKRPRQRHHVLKRESTP